MAEREFTKVTSGGNLSFVKFSELAEKGEDGLGLVLEGTYLGTVTNQYNADKPDYKFQTDDGNTIIVNSAGSLAAKMKNVEVGDIVRLTYLGKQKIARGKMAGKEAHNIEVEVATENEAS